MRVRQFMLILGAAGLAGGLGLVASVAIYGPGPLLRSELGQRIVQAAIGGDDPPGLVIADIDDLAPSFRLPDFSGRPHLLPIPGKRVLINYWASWCGPCRGEMPLLAEYARRGSPDAMIVGIAQDRPDDARAYLAAEPTPFLNLIEPPSERDSSVQLGNRQNVLPFSVLIDADGRLLKRKMGAFQDAEELEQWARRVP